MEQNRIDRRKARRRRRLRERVVSLLTVVCMLAGVFAGTLPASVFADDNFGWMIGGYADPETEKQAELSVSVVSEQDEATTSQDKIYFNTEVSGGSEPYTVQYEMYVNEVLKDTWNEFSQVLSESPSEPGDYKLVMKVTDANGDTAEASATVLVTGEGVETEAGMNGSHIEILEDRVNVRAEASVDSDIIGTVDAGTELSLMDTITAEDGSIWYQVKLDGEIGYVRADLAQAFETESESESESEDVTETESDSERQERVLTWEDEKVTITVKGTAGVVIPDEVTDVQVVPIVSEDEETAEQYADVQALVQEQAEKNAQQVAGFLAYDIKLIDAEGNEVEPTGAVSVSMEYKQPVKPEETAGPMAASVDEEEPSYDISVMHLKEDEAGNVEDVVDLAQNDQLEELSTTDQQEVEKVSFTTDSFSYYVVIWGKPDDAVVNGAEFTQTASDGRFEVTVAYGSDAKIPEDAEFKVTEYAEGTDTFTETLNSYDSGFDWLIDMGFYKDGEEIEPEAPVQVYMSIAQSEKSDAYSLVHFAKDGEAEEYPASELNTTVDEDGVASINLEMDSFSLVAGRRYLVARMVDYKYVVNHPNVNYLIYKEINNQYNFLSWNAEPSYWDPNYMNTAVVKTSLINNNSDGKLTVESNKLYIRKDTVSVDRLKWGWNNTWWISNNTGGFQAAGTNYWLDLGGWWWTSPYVKFSYYNTDLKLTQSGSDIIVSKNSNDFYKNLQIDNYTVTSTSQEYALKFAIVENDDFAYDKLPETSGGSYYPPAVYTGQIENASTYFYNLADAEDGNLSANGLMGVEYTIYYADGDEAGSVAKTITTNSDMKVVIDGLPNGNYTMKQTAVPDQYMLNPEEWRFSISEGQRILEMTETSTGNKTGVVFNILKNGKLDYDKTAEVDDYANRTYKVNLTAKAQLKKYLLRKTNITFVLDQSNSMLFPANLEDTGYRLHVNGSKGNRTADYNDFNALDKNELYYVITDPNSSSTVYAVWYDGKAWMYQDASWYAKAYWNPKGDTSNAYICTANHTRYPDSFSPYVAYDTVNGQITTWVSGGCFCNQYLSGQNLKGSSFDLSTMLDNMSYPIYRAGTSGVYNRLHYLEQSTADLIEAIGSISPGTHVTLETFTSQVNPPIVQCNLDKNGINTLLGSIGSITTDGGTRQDIALEKAKDFVNKTEYDDNYVVLITDGAPAVGSRDTTAVVGTFQDLLNNTLYDSKGRLIVYTNMKNKAKELKDAGATLITIGLGMENVESGSKAMKYISTYGENEWRSTAEYGTWWYQPKDTSKLTAILVSNLLQKMIKKENVYTKGTITDYISDTFYPIDPDNKRPLRDGEWINLSGKPVSNTASDKAGQVIYEESTGWRVEWKDAKIDPRISQNPQNGWNGTVYIKAKEDFIGGNVIQTNKSATLKVTETNQYPWDNTPINHPIEWEFPYPKPDVNVRLLDFDHHSTEVTVFLGDKVSAYIKNLNQIPLPTPDNDGESPEAAIKELYNKIAFTKIVDSDSNAAGNWTVNKAQASDWNGRKDNTADYSGTQQGTNTGWTTWSSKKILLKDLGDAALSDNELAALIRNADNADNGTASITKEYQYSPADGYVGAFTYTVKKESKQGEPADFYDHQSQITGEDVETYTLTVTYVPYPKGNGENGRGENHHNGTDGPGKEDNAADNPMTLKSENKHIINVIDGEIDLVKYLNVNTKPTQDVTFTFKVERIAPTDQTDPTDPAALYDFEKDGNGNEDQSKTKKQAEVTVTIPANSTVPYTSSEAKVTGLPRGTYVVTEIEMPDDYMLDSMADNGSNCKYVISEDNKNITFTIGTYTESDQDHNALESLTYDNNNNVHTAQKGVLGKAKITNVEAIHNTGLKLTKQDSTSTTTLLKGAEFTLYEDEACSANKVVSVYTDIELTETNKKDVIKTGEDGSLQVYGIPYRSDGTTVYYLKETKAPKDYLKIDGIVKVEIDGDGKMTFTYGKLNAQNKWEEIKTDATFNVDMRMTSGTADNEVIIKDPPLYDLPSAGGTGIFLYIISGMLLMIAAGLTYIKSRRRGVLNG